MNQTETVQKYIEDHHLLTFAQRILVAVSGGADSVCLLLMLHALHYKLECAHCNFHLRSKESDRDEQFVRSLCRRLDIPLHIKSFDTLEYAKREHLSIEMAARQLRYDYFNTLLDQQHLDVVCVGHHSDDNVETLLLNLIRGTGLRGLCGIQPRQGRVIRPLLCLSHNDILNWLEQQQQTYITDSTNLRNDFARNKIRLDILPMLRQVNPAVDQNILHCIDNMNEVRRMYQYCVDEFCSACLDSAEELDIATILRAPSPLCVLHEMLAPLGFNRSQTKDILRNIHHTGCCYQSATHRLTINRSQIVITELRDETQESDSLHPLFDLSVAGIQSSTVPNCSTFHFFAAPEYAYFDAGQLQSKKLYLRHIQRGDRFWPFGMKGTRLVSDLLTDLKYSVFEKERQLVLCADDDIIWVVGCRSSQLFRVTETTKDVLILHVTKAEPSAN